MNSCLANIPKMKRPKNLTSAVLPVFFLASVFFAPNFYAAAQATNWQQIPVPPLPAFKPPQPKRIALPNGMVIFLQEDHELPLIDLSAKVRGGSHDEPADKVGLANIYGHVWRTGGTQDQTGDQLDDYLEIRAAKVETSGGPDSTTISLNCLKGDFDDVFKIFVDLLRNPGFRADKLDLAQKRADDSISRRNDEIGEIAARVSTRMAYGADNPYAREPEYSTIAAITRDDLVAWHQKYVQPNHIILGIDGDFDSAAMEAKLRAAFESWPKGEDLSKADIQYHPAAPGYYLVNKEDVNQSNIYAVTLGTTRSNPDYYALSVFNKAFGGGFSSRLFNDIRTKRGLAYEVGGGVGANFGHPGIERFLIATKSQSTIESIEALDQDIENLSRQPISADEIKHAKEAILNAFIFRLDSPDKVLAERIAYEFYGYPANWLDEYRAKIEQVTADDVNRVAKKYVHLDQLAILVVGNTKEFDKPLSSLGPVHDVDITIPPPPGMKDNESAKVTESNDEGKAIAAKVVAALGGEEKLATIKAVKAELTITQKTPQGEMPMPMETVIVYPDHLRAEIHPQGMTMDVVVTPDAAFMAVPGQGVRDMPASQKRETMEQIKRDPIFITSHWKDGAVFFRGGEIEKIGDTDARIVDVNADGTALRWYVDEQTGRILKQTYATLAEGKPARGETNFSDWKPMGGLTIPTVRHNKQNGEDSSTSVYSAFEINPTVDHKIFEKPASGQ